MRELYFVRHGQTEWNAAQRMQGQWNSDLNDIGRAQAQINGQLLADVGIEAMYASPLDRTRQTAAIINHHLSLPIAYDDRILEWDCGDWSGHRHDEVAEKWPREWVALQADRFNYRGPNCENYPDMMRRAKPFLEEIKRQDACRIAIVSHGMIGKVMMSMLLGLTEAETVNIHQPNDVVIRVSLNGDEARVDHYKGGRGPFEGVFID